MADLLKYRFQSVLDYIQKKYDIIDITMNLFFNCLVPVSMEKNQAVLVCDNDFKRTILYSKNYVDMLLDGLKHEFNSENVDITLITKEEYESCKKSGEMQTKPKEPERLSDDFPEENTGSVVNPDYTFENFVVGSTNRVAYETSKLVCEHPAEYYNPLFIYGPSGLGKTHLLFSIINEIKSKNPDFNVVYITCEEFTNMLVDSISKKIDPSVFRSKFRNLDFFLVDDIEFLMNKRAVQQEMFHTFEALFNSGKQIVFASDKQPSDMENIDKRLTSRFSAGGVIDIEPPDVELRQAIFKRKAESYGVDIPNDVLEYLAQNIKTNIRDIEGAIKTLKAHSLIGGEKISFAMANRVLSDYLKKAEEDNINSEKILKYVSMHCGVRKEDIVSAKRDMAIKDARHLCAYLMRNMLNMTYKEIGSVLHKHHTTIMDSCVKIENSIKEDEAFRNEIQEIKRELTI